MWSGPGEAASGFCSIYQNFHQGLFSWTDFRAAFGRLDGISSFTKRDNDKDLHTQLTIG